MDSVSSEQGGGRPSEGFSAVIPAGGVGSRLWPLSRSDRPKFLLDLLGTGRSLLQDTVARVEVLADRVLVVTGEAHAAAVREQLPSLGADDLVAEPSPRDSMAAIGLAAALLERRHGPHVLGAFSADHVIQDPQAFAEAVAVARQVAEAGFVATIGITPRDAATGFGYIRAGAALDGIDGAFAAEAFTEKPELETAIRFLEGGGHFWNAGMYVTRTDVLLGHLARLQPSLHDGVRELAEAWDTPQAEEVRRRVWPLLTRIAIDYAIAEPVAAVGGVAVVPADLGWHDIGDFAVLATLVQSSADGVTRVGRKAPVVTVEAADAMVVGGERLVAIVGLDGITVVDTPGALLVLGPGSSQRVKDAAVAAEGAG